MWVVRVALRLAARIANRDIQRTGGVELPLTSFRASSFWSSAWSGSPTVHCRKACPVARLPIYGSSPVGAAEQVLKRRLAALKPPRAVPAEISRNRPRFAESLTAHRRSERNDWRFTRKLLSQVSPGLHSVRTQHSVQPVPSDQSVWICWTCDRFSLV
jgi:hypothetical protein